MESSLHEAASAHLPPFITAPGQTDVLLVLMAILLIAGILGAGVFFFWLHSLPERMVHNKAQFDIVAVLALLSLFTHIHAFWIAALLLALIKFPDFSFPGFGGSMSRIANSLEAMAQSRASNGGPKASPVHEGQSLQNPRLKPSPVPKASPPRTEA